MQTGVKCSIKLLPFNCGNIQKPVIEGFPIPSYCLSHYLAWRMWGECLTRYESSRWPCRCYCMRLTNCIHLPPPPPNEATPVFHFIVLQFYSISLCHCKMECTASTRWRSVKLLRHHSDRGGKNVVQMALNPLCTCTLERGGGERGIKKVVLWCKPNSRYAIFSD